MDRGRSPYAVLLSEGDFGRGSLSGREVRELPAYAAFCLGDGLVRA